MDLKGSKTEANLMTAFSGECMARVKYGIYAGIVRGEGYEGYGREIETISSNEREHAEVWFRALSAMDITALQALEDAEEGELYECDEMYPHFAAVAREEGFTEIAELFEGVARIERRHAGIYRRMADNVRDAAVFSSDRPAAWVCLSCGNVAEGLQPPEICPVCGHDKSYRVKERG